MSSTNFYGTCDCGCGLAPSWFTEQESVVENGRLIWTGRYRKAVNSLDCRSCLRTYPIDDTFDGKWIKGGADA